ncbi:MAG: ATP-dependent DNA ligase [Pseudomonadota bacterium]
MRRFIELYSALDQTNSTRAKVAALADYFSTTEAADLAWAVYFLSGRRLRRLVGSRLLQQWLSEASELPDWLVTDTYANVGDLAETIALLLADRVDPDALSQTTLSGFVSATLQPLAKMDDTEKRAVVTGLWQALPYDACYVVNKLITGALRVGVSQTLVATALAQVAELPRPVILHRMMGQWQPDAQFAERLMSADDGQTAQSQPYPFFLASPLETQPGELSVAEVGTALGARADWIAEWKWDGIRGQLICRNGERYLWSRGEELITAQFPDVTGASAPLPDGTVIDGEILAWRDDAPMSFAALQRRIGRKKPGKKTLNDYPAALRAYDLLEWQGEDIRDRPLTQRRALLEALHRQHPDAFALSETLDAENWQALADLRAASRARSVEGLMLKFGRSAYGTGRKRGDWWKWKIEPHTVDAVMLYAQAGHGRRANRYTDYTFAVWRDDELVPIAKAYSGLTDVEIDELDRWIRRHTKERFGPVRAVQAAQVFELAFEAIARSTRHKSGVALRFPRIRRWRRDLAVKDADTLASLEALLP